MIPELYSREIKYNIKVLETTVFYQKFPKPLKVYLLETYKYGNWPYGYHEGELYGMIFQDARDYFNGKLDTTIKPPIVNALEEISNTRDQFGEAIRTVNDLEEYIDELHEMLWANGLEGSRMLHDETGEHKGTYAEFNTLHPEDFE